MQIKRILLMGIISAALLNCSVTAQIPYLDQVTNVHQKVYVNKEVLNSQDLDIIDRFVNAGIENLLNAIDTHEAAKIRKEMTSLSGQADRDQYSQQFIVSLEKKLPDAFQTISNWEDDQPKARTARDLLILIAKVSAPELVTFAMEFINSENLTVRYWAVKALANPQLTGPLNSPDYTQLKTDVFSRLSQVINNDNSDEILHLVIKFAGKFTDNQSTNLIQTVAQKRIEDYEKWNVDFELIETDLLKALGKRIQNASADRKKQLASVFAQLYSHVIQRYIKGKDILTPNDRTQLASVIVDVEQNVIGQLTGIPQSGLKKAVEMKIESRIKTEYQNLLDAGGTLQNELDFQYDNPSGSGPRELPEPDAQQ